MAALKKTMLKKAAQKKTTSKKITPKKTASKKDPEIMLVPATLRVFFKNGWNWEFSSQSTNMPDTDGDFYFDKHDKQFQVVLTLKDSGNIRFLKNADACIGFKKDECPTAGDNDKDVFKNIAVSEDRMSLSFLNLNKNKTFQYALFVRDGIDGPVIPHDPRIINK